jgi:hypothetical protein
LEIEALKKTSRSCAKKFTDEASSATASKHCKANAYAVKPGHPSKPPQPVSSHSCVTNLESIIIDSGAIGKHDAEIAKCDAQLASEQSMQKQSTG